MKLVGVLMEYQEASRGNLRRCLDHLARVCDEVAVYDDGSEDDSVAVARAYTPLVIEGRTNDYLRETAHRQALLELALSRSPDYVVWLDADEVFDRWLTEGGIRALCETGASWSLPEVTLWRSTRWQRLDLWEGEVHPRLWKVPASGILRIPVRDGLHQQLVPDGLAARHHAEHAVLHFGFATREAIERRWRERTRHGVPVAVRRRTLDERDMRLAPVPRAWFPPGVDVPETEPQPEPIRYAEDLMREAGL